MSRKTVWLTSTLTVLLLLVVFLSWGFAAEKSVIHWKGQNSFPPAPEVGPIKEAGYALTGNLWAKWVKDVTNGRLVIDLAPPGAIVPVAESFLAVKKGVLQVVAPCYATYYAGTMPEGHIEVGLPFAFSQMEEMWNWLFSYGAVDIFKKAYAEHNIVWLANVTNTIQGIGGNFPIDKPDAIKGKKIRAPGTQGDLIKLLGGIPVTVPWGDIYMALKLGTIDGYFGGISALEENKLKEVVSHYFYSPNQNVAATTILINKEAFKALPEDIQKTILRDSESIIMPAAQQVWAADNWTVHHSGVKMHTWSKEDTQKVTQMAVETIYPKLASGNANCAKLVELTIKFMKDYGKIK